MIPARPRDLDAAAWLAALSARRRSAQEATDPLPTRPVVSPQRVVETPPRNGQGSSVHQCSGPPIRYPLSSRVPAESRTRTAPSRSRYTTVKASLPSAAAAYAGLDHGTSARWVHAVAGARGHDAFIEGSVGTSDAEHCATGVGIERPARSGGQDAAQGRPAGPGRSGPGRSGPALPPQGAGGPAGKDLQGPGGKGQRKR